MNFGHGDMRYVESATFVCVCTDHRLEKMTTTGFPPPLDLCVCVCAMPPFIIGVCESTPHTLTRHFSKKDSPKLVTSSMSEYAYVIRENVYIHEIYLGGGSGPKRIESNHGGRIFRIQRAAEKIPFLGLRGCCGVCRCSRQV